MTAITAIPLLRSRSSRLDPTLTIVVPIVITLVAVAVAGPFIAPYAPNQTDVLDANAAWSDAHWLGTDALGRDILSRALYGARLSLLSPALVVLLASMLAAACALAAAWHGGWVDKLMTRVFDFLFAFPGLLLAVLAVSVFGVGLGAPVVAITLTYVPYIGRVVRLVALHERHSPYIQACSLAGIPAWRIVTRHLLPGLLPMIRAQATVSFGSALTDLAAVSFIGLGVQPPTAEWGVMVAEGQASLLNGHPAQSLTAGGLIVLTVVAFNVLGERLTRREELRR
jgi:peptide/nickel transport system permease protein